jgi:hypothetical protein
VTDLQFIAAIVNSLAWPAAVVVAAVLLRGWLAGAFGRARSLEFPGRKATFATLLDYENMIALPAASQAGSRNDAGLRGEATEFSAVEALASAAPGQAIIDAWGLLEYQLNITSDRLAPDQPHGWPQVSRTLETWDRWPLIYPAVVELRRLRDYAVASNTSPSSTDAARYVSVAQDLVTTLRTALLLRWLHGPRLRTTSRCSCPEQESARTRLCRRSL